MSRYSASYVQCLLLMAAVAVSAAFPDYVDSAGQPAAAPSAQAQAQQLTPEAGKASTELPGLLPPSRYRAQVIVEQWLAGD